MNYTEHDYVQAKQDELLTLQSIYPDQVHLLPPDSTNDGHAARGERWSITLDINLPALSSFSITPSTTTTTSTSTSTTTTTPAEPTQETLNPNVTTTSAHLPPVTLILHLPPFYPYRSPPRLVEVIGWGVHDRLTDRTARAGREGAGRSWIGKSLGRGLRRFWDEVVGLVDFDQGDEDDEDDQEEDDEDKDDEDRNDEEQGIPILWAWTEWISSGQFLPPPSNGPNGSLTQVPPLFVFFFFSRFTFYLPTPSPPPHSRTPTRPDSSIPYPHPSTLLALISQTTRLKTRLDFERRSYDCGICMEKKRGKGCVRVMGCACVFCKECLAACWGLAIREGTIGSVSCPSVECTKLRNTHRPVAPLVPPLEPPLGSPLGSPHVDESQGEEKEMKEEIDRIERTVDLGLLEEVVGKEGRVRFEWLVRKRRVENDPSYTTCPQKHCQAPVPTPPAPRTKPSIGTTLSGRHVFRLGPARESVVEEISEEVREERRKREEDKWERYRVCGDCGFSFCRYCLTGWHGAHLPCPLPSTASFLKTYLTLEPGSKEAQAYERRYGKKNLERLALEFQENEANRSWLENNTRPCSGCGTRVQKSQGCNHMVCSKCSAHFCYRCGQALRPSDPYMHFRTQGSSCFEKLFDADEIARFEREVNGEGGGIEVEGGLLGDGWEEPPLQGGAWWRW